MTDTMERIDPDLIRPDDQFGVAALELHLARYRFAATYVLGRVVVDCACGTGYGSAMLADAGAAAVTGVDVSEEAIAYARAHHARHHVDFRVGDALTFVPERPPEVWVTLETVEHLPHPARYLDRIHRLLAPGGWLIASVPTTVSTDGNPFHLVDFTAHSWRTLVATHGFAIERELGQIQPFTLRDALRRSAPDRPRRPGGIVGFYLRHPKVAWARLALTVTRGLVNEYVVIAARRVDRP
jgi:SAM-dependent methyltransferase